MSDYSVNAIANEFIRLGANDSNPMSNLLIQKLLYYAYGHFLAFENAKMFEDEIEAWMLGPVVPNLYWTLKDEDKCPNDRVIVDPLPTEETAPELDAKRLGMVKMIYDRYGRYDPLALVRMTHEKGSPWHKTLKSGNKIIRDDLIRDDFEKLLVNRK